MSQKSAGNEDFSNDYAIAERYKLILVEIVAEVFPIRQVLSIMECGVFQKHSPFLSASVVESVKGACPVQRASRETPWQESSIVLVLTVDDSWLLHVP